MRSSASFYIVDKDSIDKLKQSIADDLRKAAERIAEKRRLTGDNIALLLREMDRKTLKETDENRLAFGPFCPGPAAGRPALNI